MMRFDCFVKHALGVVSPSRGSNVGCALGYPIRLKKCLKCKHFSMSKWMAHYIGAPTAEGLAAGVQDTHDVLVKSCEIRVTGKNGKMLVFDEFHSDEKEEPTPK